MKNWMKRSLCLVLALAMVLSCAFAASAEENPGVAVNAATGQEYDNLDLALREAGAGETVRLTADVQTEVVLVREDMQLDLNGHTLTADYAASSMSGKYFRVNVYLYNGKFTKVAESAQIEVFAAS